MRPTILKYLLTITLLGAAPAVASTTMQRQLSQTVQWNGCNQFHICYTLSAETADLGQWLNRYYASPIKIKIYKRNALSKFEFLREIDALEGQWNAERNQWILRGVKQPNNTSEYIFMPDLLDK